MGITATTVANTDTLEKLRQEYNNLQADVLALNTGALTVFGVPNGTETVSGDGSGKDAISLNTLISFLNTSGGNSDLTLATGQTGQIKILLMTSAGGNTATLDKTDGNLDTTAVSTSIVFNAIGESVTLVWSGSKWFPINALGATIT